jgi:hypothetical protein
MPGRTSKPGLSLLVMSSPCLIGVMLGGSVELAEDNVSRRMPVRKAWVQTLEKSCKLELHKEICVLHKAHIKFMKII